MVDDAEVKAANVNIYPRDGFIKYGFSKNFLAGIDLSRGGIYFKANVLKPYKKGQVGAGLGTTTS
ncbi:hypothetical protein ACVGXC_00560, partial [Enterobacter hormaechei]